MSGKSADVDPKVVAEFKERPSSIIGNYNLDDIFNCDETGVFYRSLPDKTLVYKGDSANGKHSKERLTVLFACSKSGEKLNHLSLAIRKTLVPFGDWTKTNSQSCREATRRHG